MSPVIHNTNRREKLILFLHYIIVINQVESKLTSSALHVILCAMILYCPQNVSSAEYVVSILTATPHPPLYPPPPLLPPLMTYWSSSPVVIFTGSHVPVIFSSGHFHQWSSTPVVIFTSGHLHQWSCTGHLYQWSSSLVVISTSGHAWLDTEF